MEGTKKKVIIVGGGLIGPIAGILFKRRGFEVVIVEKRSDLRVVKEDKIYKSINIAITAKGIHTLKVMDLWKRTKEGTIPIMRRYFKLKTQPGRLFNFGQGEPNCIYQADRNEINKKFLNFAEEEGIEIKFKWKTSLIDFEKQIVQNDKGEELPYDLLIGADGVGSQVRKELFKHIENSVETRCKTEWHPVKYKELLIDNDCGKFDKNTQATWIAGEVGNILGFPRSTSEGYSAVFNFSNKTIEDLNDDREKVSKFFNETFPEVVELQPNLLEQYFEHSWSDIGKIDVWPWAWKNVVLIGDSAHAISPYIGQGMNCGLQDIHIISQLIDKHGVEAVEKVFDEFQNIQKPSADSVGRIAWENYLDLANFLEPNVLIRFAMEEMMMKKFPDYIGRKFEHVANSLTPYAEAEKRLTIQAEIIEELTIGLTQQELDKVDWEKCEKMVKERLSPLNKEYYEF
jgi:kynurenine 3-monooxygenase